MQIGLNMIVRNEAHIILEGLESICPLIDTYVIVDTGSTDNTKQVIKTFFDKKKISGFIYDSEWKDFGTNRSEALRLCNGKMDYAIVLDADDLIFFPKNAKEFLKNNLQKYSCALMYIIEMDNRMKHRRMQIFKVNDGWFYKDVLHEYAENEKQDKQLVVLPDEFYMVSRRLGGRRQNKTKEEKMDEDLQVLLAGLKKEPKNERYVFSIAQIYADKNLNEDAIAFYKKRLQMPFVASDELQFICQFRLSMCYAALQNIIEAEYWGNLAFQTRPTRSESLLFLAKLFRGQNEFYKSYQYILKGKNIPYPKTDLTFVFQDAYLGGFDREACLVEYIIFPEKRETIGKQIIKNYFFTDINFDLNCVKLAISKIKSKLTPLCIDVHFFGDGFQPKNFFVLEDSSKAIVRYSDFEIKNKQFKLLSTNINSVKAYTSFDVSSKTALVSLNTLETTEILCDKIAPFQNTEKPRGIEDIRLYNWEGQIFFTGNSYGEYNKNVPCSIVHGVYNKEKNIFTDVIAIDSPLQQSFEKNWLHIPGTDTFIYSWHPLRLCKIRKNKCIIFKVIDTPKYFSNFRGSASPVIVNQKLLCLVHFSIRHDNNTREYYHNFIEFSNDGSYKIERVSHPFFFREQSSIEFCICMKFNKEENSIHCYTTLNDNDASINTIQVEDIFWNDK